MKFAYIAIAVALVSQTIGATEPAKPSTGFGPGISGDESAKRFIEDHLNNCPETEVRCLWFSGDRIYVAEMMTLDLKNWQVMTVCHGHNWADRGHLQRKLTRWQIEGLKQAMTELPPLVTTPDYSKSVQIAYWQAGKLQRRSYDKKACPIEVRRAYEIGGGEAPFEYQAKADKITQPAKQ